MWPQAQGHLEPQTLEEAGRTLPWSLWRGHSPAWIPAALPRLDLRPWCLQLVEEGFLWFFSHLVCGHLLDLLPEDPIDPSPELLASNFLATSLPLFMQQSLLDKESLDTFASVAV